MSTPIGVNTNINVIIKEIVARAYSPTQLIYSVTAIGTDVVNFIDVMKSLLMQANAQNAVPASTVLQLLLSIAETLTITDTLVAPTTTSPPYKWGADPNAGRWNFATWG